MCIWLLAVMPKSNWWWTRSLWQHLLQFKYIEIKWEEFMPDAFWTDPQRKLNLWTLTAGNEFKSSFPVFEAGPNGGKNTDPKIRERLLPLFNLGVGVGVMEASKIHWLGTPIRSIISWSIDEASFCLRSTSTIPTSQSTSAECTSSQPCSKSIQSEER